MVVGHDDVHVVKDGGQGALPAPVSVVISTRLKPGQEAAYRRWEQRIAAAQAKAPGFQGYRFEPPTPGVQDDWLSILRFDTEAHLQAWLDSPERHALLEAADAFTERFNARIVRTGFDQWFPPAAGGAPAIPAWKMNMVVLLLLYPIVLLFGAYVETPLLMGKLGLRPPVTLFISNVVSIILLTYAVPWASRRLDWWLGSGKSWRRADLAGAALMIVLYGVMLSVFTRFF
jgi:antibiotic biosynthesis monooxygenase (ABM) superfamily enzyme